jgi:carbamoylphosphate synthase large subunit
MTLPLPDPPPRILLGTAGTGTTWGILSSLRERWGEGVHVTATDMAPGHTVAATALADAFHQVPAVSDEEAFCEVLFELLAEHRVNSYLPTFDAEIVLAGRLRDEGRLDGIRLLAAETWAAEVCWDKLRAAEWLVEEGIPSPATARLDRREWNGAPLCLKPRMGVGSVGVEQIPDEPSFARWQERDDSDAFLVQEHLPGPELTLDCFRSRQDGWTRVLCRERVETKAGVSTKARVFEADDALFGIASSVGERLELGGSYCLQVMQSGDERGWLVTDINPRTGAGTRLCTAVGVDFPAATLADAWGLPAKPLLPRLDRERWVVRQYREIVLV